MRKVILTLFVSILASTSAYGNINGYIESLSEEFSNDLDFVIEENNTDSDGVTTIKMTSPSYYDCQFAILMIGGQMRKYSNIKMVKPWTESDSNSFSVEYRVGTSCLSLFLYSIGDDDGVHLYISEYEGYYKSTYKHRNHRKPHRR